MSTGFNIGSNHIIIRLCSFVCDPLLSLPINFDWILIDAAVNATGLQKGTPSEIGKFKIIKEMNLKISSLIGLRLGG